MRDLKTILAPTDFSDTSALALDYATELAQAFSARLHLLHVVEPAALYPAGLELWGYSLPSLIDQMELSAEKRLAALGTDADLPQPIARRARVGQPFVEILRYARDHAVDLIVLGTHGRGAVEHLLMGSVAERVVRASTCPVLTVRLPVHRFVMP
jgi:nucleotide-binding universal stress UspA family protein